MRILYITMLFLVVGGLLVCLFRTMIKKQKLSSNLIKVQTAALIEILANLVIATVADGNISMICFCIFFACLDWNLLYMLQYTIDLTKSGEKIIRYPILKVLVALDSISLLLNVFFQHAFECKQFLSDGGEAYYKAVAFPLYGIHVAICYFLILASIYLLVVKLKKSPKIYRKKYRLILEIFVLVVAVDAIYAFTSTMYNFSVIGFAVGCILMYYYAALFVPWNFLNRTLSKVIHSMSDALFIMDEDGGFLQGNTSAVRLAEKEHATLEDFVQKLVSEPEIEEFISRTDGNNEKESDTYYRNWSRDGKQVYYRVTVQQMFDEKHYYLGYYIILQDLTEEVGSIESERYVANHDELTGLYNKQFFYKRVREVLDMYPDTEYYMICSDIQNFKFINDIYGSEMGDRVLRRMAATLRKHSQPDEVYGRFENDRFGLLIKKENFDEAKLAEQIDMEVREGETFSFRVDSCLGVYEITERHLAVVTMCDRAMIAIKTIKGSYDKRIAYYNDDLRLSIVREQHILGRLPIAMAQERIMMYLQPQVDADGKMVGAEALARWKKPDGTIEPPEEFIPILEKTGAIIKLDKHIWELACKTLRKWKFAGRNDLYISVNISPKDFYFIDIYQVLVELVEKYNVSPNNLKLEITESAVMSDVKANMELIDRLRQYGFTVEMDDFGSAYSSLNMLKDIQVDVVKIDMAFIGATKNADRATTILKMIVNLSKQLKIPVVIEGVETGKQFDELREMGCDLFQGYFFSKPMDILEFEKKYF